MIWMNGQSLGDVAPGGGVCLLRRQWSRAGGRIPQVIAVTCHHPLHLPQCPCLHHHHYYHHYHLHLHPNNLFLCQTIQGCTRSLLKTEPGTIN